MTYPQDLSYNKVSDQISTERNERRQRNPTSNKRISLIIFNRKRAHMKEQPNAKKKFNLSTLLRIGKEAFQRFMDDNVLRLSALMNYATLFSIIPFSVDNQWRISTRDLPNNQLIAIINILPKRIPPLLPLSPALPHPSLVPPLSFPRYKAHSISSGA